VRTFTKTEPVSLSNPTMQPCLLAKPVDGLKVFCCSRSLDRIFNKSVVEFDKSCVYAVTG